MSITRGTFAADSPPTSEPERFIAWASQQGVDRAGTAPFYEVARRLFDAAGSTRVTAEVTDSVIWQEESAGSPEHRIRLIRAVASAMTQYQGSGAAGSAETARAPGHVSGRPTVEALRAMIDGCIQNQHRRMLRAEPRGAECKTVLEVAPLCPASQLGVKKGDLLMSVNMTKAVEYQTDGLFEAGAHEWEFYLRDSRELLQVKTNGLPMGMVLGPTAASAQAGYKMDADDLMALWELGEYQAVHDRARSVVGKTTGLFGGRKGNRECAEYPVLGAALIELGNAEEGFEILQDFLEHYAQGWTRNYAGIALYYFAWPRWRATALRQESLRSTPTTCSSATRRSSS